jgi:hypothetical protein
MDSEMALIKLELSKYGDTVLIEGCQLRFISDLNTWSLAVAVVGAAYCG